jgi:hypothetical protein
MADKVPRLDRTSGARASAKRPNARIGWLRRSPTMAASAHKWEFRARFRRHAFGWKSQPAIKRIKEAVAEIKKVARKDKMRAAEGAVLLLEKLSSRARARRQLVWVHRQGSQQRHRRARGCHRCGARRRQDSRRLTGTTLGSLPRGRDPLHRAAGRPLGRALRVEGDSVALGRSAHVWITALRHCC